MTSREPDASSTKMTVEEWLQADHWLYRWYDAAGVLLYLGLTINPERRSNDHRRAWWRQWAEACAWEGPIPGRDEAFVREADAVIRERPIFNRSRDVESEQRMRAYIASRGGDPDAFAEHYPKGQRTKPFITRPIQMRTEIWAQLDRLADLEGVHRSTWIQRAVAARLDQLRDQPDA